MNRAKPVPKHEFRVYHDNKGDVVGFGEYSEVVDELAQGKYAVTAVEAVSGRLVRDNHVVVGEELVQELRDKPDKIKTLKVKDGQVTT